MKAKTLLMAAAALAAGIVTSQAQVYSQNIVGYMNIPLTNGFTLYANQLDVDGSGTNNTVESVFGSQVSGLTVYAFSGGSYYSAGYSTKGGWSGSTNVVDAALSVGSAVFVKVNTATNITVVGNVLTGTNVVNFTPGAYNLVGSPTPQAGSLSSLGYVPTSGDSTYQFDPATQSYITGGYSTKGGWSGEPNLRAGEGFFLKAAASNPGTWSQVLTNQ